MKWMVKGRYLSRCPGKGLQRDEGHEIAVLEICSRGTEPGVRSKEGILLCYLLVTASVYLLNR